ncbi:flagellar biosynthetic protein FliO [Erwinia tracheiphila]|uniref:Flagellar protein n=1 Tax=Erwinia tracheiphila TaxID=65700 RepID=A0A0M2KC51_9GAMM|nr:flagellar biosynthetic protein FliO [Erwinia tracheiphila]AXF76116.1 flagellar biosynthetic protein FliO [Erwinia tracheiphila]EOS96714.1 flagellar biosynthesis protein FliO [Erwinia tracheiphila PSU-1]KKF34843.1 flagellar assembly protein FliO [Erwinia tracheiphila]UIA85219.1 flagellar biosynthetic protein FliO [Erwinia tracheiphila]UIA86506.1 flagellar biosynthetic protein FliO [Erwinia tracheiphila]
MNNNTVQTQPSTAVGQPVMSTASTLTQVSSVLAIIILLILICAWIAKRLGFTPKRGSSGHSLSVSASCQVGQRERVVIVDVEDTRLVLGVTSHNISLLHALPPQDSATESKAGVDFRQAMQQLIKRRGKPE